MLLKEVASVVLVSHSPQLLELTTLTQLCERILVGCRVVQVDERVQGLAATCDRLATNKQVVE